MSGRGRAIPLGLQVAARLLPPNMREEVLGDLIEVWNERRRSSTALSCLVWEWKQPLAVLYARLALARISAREPAFAGMLTDLRVACRSLAKARTFTIAVVMTLAVAIGSNAAIFSIVDSVLVDPLEFWEADRLVTIAGSAPGTNMPEEFDLSAEFYLQYRENADLLDDLGMFMAGEGTLRTEDHVEQIFMVQALPTVFSTLGARPIAGRLPRPDERIGSVALISHSIWNAWFGSDPSIIGRSYDIAGAPRTIVGVMGRDFHFPDERTSVWIHATLGDMDDIRPGSFRFRLVGRTKPGVAPADLAEQLTALAARLPERVGGSPEYVRIIDRHRAVVRSLEEDLVGDASGPLRLLFGTVTIVFLVACANVMNLMLLRGESRQKELSVRRALGAGRWGLVRMRMVEALVLTTLGGMVGWALAWVGLPLILRAAPPNIPNLSSTSLDGTALLYTSGLAMIAAFALALAPALRRPKATRIGALGLAGPTDRSSRGLARSALVTLQTASALVLLVASGLLVRSYWTLTQVDPGYVTEDVFTFQIATGGRDVRDPLVYRHFHDDFRQRLAALPGVQSVGMTEFLPLDEGAGSTTVLTEGMRASREAPANARYTRVAGDYFPAMAIDLVRGRFLALDGQTGVDDVLVSQYAADMLWPGEDPVGRRIAVSDTTRWRTVVGVVENILPDDLRQTDAEPMIYLSIPGATPDGWTFDSPVYVIRSERAASLADDVRAIVREVAPESPVYRLQTMDALARRKTAALSFTMLMIGMAAMLALLLGVVGLYGVLAYVVDQRRAEIAVRIAVGAETKRVRRMVVLQGVRLTLLGVALGLFGAAFGTRLLASLLFGVGALDLATFAVMSTVLLFVALTASYVPAARAARLDPMRLLRGE